MISSQSSRNLDFIFDSDMSFSDQINSVFNSCHFHIQVIIEFIISFHFQQPQLFKNWTTAIHYTRAFHKQISTNFNAVETHWYMS